MVNNKITFMSMLASENYLPLNRMLLKILGINAAVYFAELCNYYVYFCSRGMLDEEGLFYVTHDYIEKKTTLTAKQQRLCELTLREMSLLNVKRKGMPAKNWFDINTEKLAELLDDTRIEVGVEVNENEEEYSEDGTLQFAHLGKHDVTKGNDKFDQMGKHDVTKGNDMMLPKVTTASILYNKENRYKENRTSSSVCPNGQTAEETSSVCDKQEDDYTDVLSPSVHPKGARKRTKFTPPSLEEVKAYCKERNNSVDAEQFYDYYNAGNWMDSNGTPVKNWRQKMIAVWEKKGQAMKASPSAPAELAEPPKSLVSAYERMGLQWGREHLNEYAVNAHEMNEWRRACRDNNKFMERHSDLSGLFSSPFSFWMSYLEFVHTLIDSGSVPKAGHFKLGGKTHGLWCSEMGIKEEEVYRK